MSRAVRRVLKPCCTASLNSKKRSCGTPENNGPARRESRRQARKAIGSNFNLIYIKASIDTLVARDTKGFYKAASEMTLNNLIGFSKESRYEAPKKPELVIDTGEELLDKSVMKLFKYIIKTVAK